MSIEDSVSIPTIGILPLENDFNLTLWPALLVGLALEKLKKKPGFIIFDKSPALSTFLGQTLNASTATINPSYSTSDLKLAINLAFKGSDSLVFIFSSDCETMIPLIQKLGTRTITVCFDRSKGSTFFNYCLKQLAEVNLSHFTIALGSSYSFNRDFAVISPFCLVPKASFLPSHLPAVSYVYLRGLSEYIETSGLSRLINDLLIQLNFEGLVQRFSQYPADLTIYFAADSIFNFFYRENLVFLLNLGLRPKTFSLTIRSEIPHDAELLWIPDCSPLDAFELLKKNPKIIKSLAEYIYGGKPLVIEGFSFGVLGQSLQIGSVKKNMLNVIPVNCSLCIKAPQHVQLLPDTKQQKFFSARLQLFACPRLNLQDKLMPIFQSGSFENGKNFEDGYCYLDNLLWFQSSIPLFLNKEFTVELLNWTRARLKDTWSH